MHITRTVKIRVPDGILFGSLSLPEAMRAVILFAHGNDSGRMSQRNRFVASQVKPGRLRHLAGGYAHCRRGSARTVASSFAL
jgi:hypothetical protein